MAGTQNPRDPCSLVRDEGVADVGGSRMDTIAAAIEEARSVQLKASGCRALTNLAYTGSLCQAAVDTGALSVVLHAMWAHPGHKVLQSSACQLLSTLASHGAESPLLADVRPPSPLWLLTPRSSSCMTGAPLAWSVYGEGVECARSCCRISP